MSSEAELAKQRVLKVYPDAHIENCGTRWRVFKDASSSAHSEIALSRDYTQQSGWEIAASRLPAVSEDEIGSKLETPLSCEIEDGQLVIRIGINVLAMATEDREPFTVYDDRLQDHRKAWIVTDAMEFAKDVRNEVMNEEEDGSTPLTNMLDMVCTNALEQGCIGCEEAPKPTYEDKEDE